MAGDLAALAALLDGQGKYDKAEPLYHRALKIFKRVYGEEHYEIAVNLNNLAALKHAKGKIGRSNGHEGNGTLLVLYWVLSIPALGQEIASIRP